MMQVMRKLEGVTPSVRKEFREQERERLTELKEMEVSIKTFRSKSAGSGSKLVKKPNADPTVFLGAVLKSLGLPYSYFFFYLSWGVFKKIYFYFFYLEF
jgi:hypothetical protein